jgi:transcriptional regulator with XRE-family HTH domain
MSQYHVVGVGGKKKMTHPSELETFNWLEGTSEKLPQPPGIRENSTSDSPSDLNLRMKSSLRMEYEAKAKRIQKQLGGLKGVQERLALSQRALAKLLMVDPSTWSRWVKNEDLIPPHIWRALEWYLALEEKVPGLSPAHFLLKSQEDYRKEVELLRQKIQDLEMQMSSFTNSKTDSPSVFHGHSRIPYFFAITLLTIILMFLIIGLL